jgi:hypothetical protein
MANIAVHNHRADGGQCHGDVPRNQVNRSGREKIAIAIGCRLPLIWAFPCKPLIPLPR